MKTATKLVAAAAAVGSLLAFGAMPQAKADDVVNLDLGLVAVCVTMPDHSASINLNGDSHHIFLPGIPRSCVRI